MWVEFLKSRQGFGYFAGDKANLNKEEAGKLIDEGYVKNVEEPDVSDLPEDLPGRMALINGGLKMVSQVLASKEVLTDIKGIGEKTADEIINTLSKK